MKRIVLMIMLTMFAVLLLVTASAEYKPSSAYIDSVQTYDVGELSDDEELIRDFIRHTMPSKQTSNASRAVTSRGVSLSVTEMNAYDAFYSDIRNIANGVRTSTVLRYSAAEIYEKTEYGRTELGLTAMRDENGITHEALDAIQEIIVFDMDSVIASLLFNCPYDLYWYDKTAGWMVEYPSQIDATDDSISFAGDLVIYLQVSSDYALSGELYTCDPSFGQSVNTAAANAASIVESYAGASDREKLEGYAHEICDFVDYNYDALQEGTAYGNPWQLIWVFDGDESTNVVCEGYAKAFQYLCDITSFTNDISVITVTGTMSGGTGAGAHMWNIVKLDDGNNYLVDVTNIDEGTAGYPNQLMLAASIAKDGTNSHYLHTTEGIITYEYDESTTKAYSESELILKSGMELCEVAVSDENFPDPAFRSYVLNIFDADEDGFLSINEIAAVQMIDVRKTEIFSLEGIEFFPFLQVLWCAEAELTALDVSGNAELYDLMCYGNALTELDVTNNLKLVMLECDHCNLRQLDVSYNSALQFLRCYSNQIESLDVSHNLNLIELSCGDNPITSIDISNNNQLQKLNCYTNSGSGLTQLDISNCPNLNELACTGNQLGILDVSDCPQLETLICASCGLTELDLSNNLSLVYLQCSDNELTQLDLSNNTLLEYVYCRDNPLSFFDVLNNEELIYLDCHAINLNQIQVTHCSKLEGLDVSDNELHDLDLTDNTNLIELVCYDNLLSTLDLSGCSELVSLYCWNNDLTVIRLDGCSSIKYLICGRNKLTELNIEDCLSLENLQCEQNLLEKLNLNGCVNLTEINCSGNCLKGLDTEGLAQLNKLNAENNYYALSAVNGYFDLLLLSDFDVDNAHDWSHPLSGSILSTDESTIVSYQYDCGQGFTCTFYFIVQFTPVSDLAVLYIPQSITRIGSKAFAYTDAEAVIIPSGCLFIGSKAFAYCDKLRYVEIPSSVVSVAQDAFLECPVLTVVYKDE